MESLRMLITVLVFASAAACSFEIPLPTPTGSLEPPDDGAGVMTAEPGNDGGGIDSRDSGLVDAKAGGMIPGERDAAVETHMDATVEERQTCQARYGTTDGYLSCGEMPNECRFNASLKQATSCQEICMGAGGRCIRAIDNGEPPDSHCKNVGMGEGMGQDMCSRTDRDTELCVCSRP